MAHDHAAHEATAEGHQAEGFMLGADEPVERADQPDRPGCGPDDRRRTYRIAALAVDITVNRYLDHDPEGRMYALVDDVDAVRDEERRNAAAREGQGEPAVSAGLQGDAIQPLTLRVRPGECLEIEFENRLDEPAGFHLHGAALVLDDGRPAIASNPDATVDPGDGATYRWAVPDDQAEGTHYAHSHGDDREQSGHGLFGTVVVEAPGTSWVDPRTGDEATGWDAIVRRPDGTAFREFVVYYHEIGNETYQLLAGDGEFVPLVDPITGAYRPASRALNYRSEPFYDRLKLQQDDVGLVDEALAYSSYSFGDPATPMLRTYLGDEVKQRIVHAGPEVFHVHHAHGGGTRWFRDGVDAPAALPGVQQTPSLVPPRSERTDSQSIGPAETFDLAAECTAGGCQQGAGDFLFHCHVTHHYFSGMWGMWRVYNTEQDGSRSTDDLPPLAELPDRADATRPAVTSDELAAPVGGRTRADLVESQLPPRGSGSEADASVFDWEVQGDRYLGEPETEAEWPGYRARAPGERPPLLFDPGSGVLAFPFLRPHLGERPPFAPGHGPAPFLDSAARTARSAAPVCPSGTTPSNFDVQATPVEIPLNRQKRVVDPNGQLFTLVDDPPDEDAERVPLVVRANAGEHCVDVVLRNALPGTKPPRVEKASLHAHLVQFDVQGSDGASAGFNYEQSIRSYEEVGGRLTAAVPAGATALPVDATGLTVGGDVAIGLERADFEVRRVLAVAPGQVQLDRPLERDHAAGSVVSHEFVRYRWYVDAQVGTVFFHDHTNVLQSGRHGLFGALVVEPPASTYHDPRTGEVVQAGPVADIRTTARAAVDVDGAFRELVLLLQDDNPLTHLGRSAGSSINLRVEPLDGRAADPSAIFGSSAGDPATPVFEARAGDPLVFRTLVGASNEIQTIHLDGHWFRVEPHDPASAWTSTARIGISERMDLFVPAAGGPGRRPGDYLYRSGSEAKLREGSWGLIRVFAPDDPAGPVPLGPPGAAAPADPCPAGAAAETFSVRAVERPLPMLGGQPGTVFVADGEGSTDDGPLVLHAASGSCIEVELRNETDGPVSFHADLPGPPESSGSSAGRTPPQATAPGGRGTYRFHAAPELGEYVATVVDGGDPLANPGRGLYGAIVVGPAGSRVRDPGTGAETRTGWDVVVERRDGSRYRDFTLLLHSEDVSIGTHRMPYTERVEGTVGVNHRSAALPEEATGAAAAMQAEEPAPTPVLDAFAGDPVRINALLPVASQNHVLAVEGHDWVASPSTVSSPVSASAIGPLEAITLDLGPVGRPGDYLYGDHREPFREAGLWGTLRIRDACEAADGRRPLLGQRCVPPVGAPSGPTGLSLLLVLAAGLGLREARRRRGLRPSRSSTPPR